MPNDSNAQSPPLQNKLHETVSACFLGPHAEKSHIFKEYLLYALDCHFSARKAYHPTDGTSITPAIKASGQFQTISRAFREELDTVCELLNSYAMPFFSGRYMGHMIPETSMFSVIGWLSAILLNPNNVAYETGPITSAIEVVVGDQLCRMLGYTVIGPEDATYGVVKSKPWGHITADGTIANMESMWAARNLKFYPLSVHAAMTRGDKPLAFIANDFKVTTCDDPTNPQLLNQLTSWQILNLTPDVVLGIPDQLNTQYGITSTFLANALSQYLVQTSGKEKLMQMYNIENEPQCFISNTRHYSWPKAAALVGIGSENCISVKVDTSARLDITALSAALRHCVNNKRAVYAVVAILGSTEQGAVDPLDQMLALRSHFFSQGLSFVVHVDAAWGGYFASMIRDPPPGQASSGHLLSPRISLRCNTKRQLEALAHADSITIDPHKSGYISYPAGGLCYRDRRMRSLLTWAAPYISCNKAEGGVSIYGIEGSKPGASAVACYLHHKVLGLHKDGHGAILGEASFTSRRLAAHWSAMSDDATDFIVIPFDPVQEESDKEIIRRRILGRSNEDIVNDRKAFDVLCTLGSDLNINVFACNFRIKGQVNDDVEEANYLNKRIYSRLSITRPKVHISTVPLFLTSSVFRQENYGECVRNFQTRIGLETVSRQDLFVLRSVTTSPFPVTGEFVQTLADEFQRTLEAEVKNVITRNTVSPQTHDFIMQGLDTLYLTYRPLFYHVNGRHQLILAVRFSDPTQAAQYKAARLANYTVPFQLSTHYQTTIEDILSTGTFVGDITAGDAVSILSVEITITTVVKNRPLNSRWRDQAYPASHTPFYLYGTTAEQHLDHMLLRAPNVQITSDLVTLDCTPALTADQLASGVIVYLNRPEAAMQPFADAIAATIFKPGASFDVTVHTDAHASGARGPGLSQGGTRISSGTLALGKAMFYDSNRLNIEDFAEGEKVAAYTAARMSAATEAEWRSMVEDRLGVNLNGIS